MNKKITITLDELDVRILSLATISIRHDLERESEQTDDTEIAENKKRAAATWKRIHDEIRSQYKAQKED